MAPHVEKGEEGPYLPSQEFLCPPMWCMVGEGVGPIVTRVVVVPLKYDVVDRGVWE